MTRIPVSPLRAIAKALPPFVVVATLLVSWQAFVVAKDISPLVLPAPLDIAEHLITHAGALAEHGLVTLRETILGSVLAGVICGVLATAMTLWGLVREAVTPLSAALRATPIAAFAPAVVIWLGYGDLPKVLIAAMVAGPPLLLAMLSGLSRVDRETREVIESLSASRWEMFWKLQVPSALPRLLTALRLGVALALLGAVVGEWAGSSEGLGYVIIRAQSQNETLVVWSATFALSLLGLLLTGVLWLIERWALARRYGKESS